MANSGPRDLYAYGASREVLVFSLTEDNRSPHDIKGGPINGPFHPALMDDRRTNQINPPT